MVDDTSELGDSFLSIFRFEWEDGTTRTTEDLPPVKEGIETLAKLGREDPDCTVTVIGFEER